MHNLKYKYLLIWIFVFLWYPIVFILDAYGYGKAFMLAVFWSAIAGGAITNKFYDGSIKLLIMALYIMSCFILNFTFAEVSSVRPKSVIGFSLFWLILQGGVFVTIILMYSLSLFLETRGYIRKRK